MKLRKMGLHHILLVDSWGASLLRDCIKWLKKSELKTSTLAVYSIGGETISTILAATILPNAPDEPHLPPLLGAAPSDVAHQLLRIVVGAGVALEAPRIVVHLLTDPAHDGLRTAEIRAHTPAQVQRADVGPDPLFIGYWLKVSTAEDDSVERATVVGLGVDGHISETRLHGASPSYDRTGRWLASSSAAGDRTLLLAGMDGVIKLERVNDDLYHGEQSGMPKVDDGGIPLTLGLLHRVTLTRLNSDGMHAAGFAVERPVLGTTRGDGARGAAKRSVARLAKVAQHSAVILEVDLLKLTVIQFDPFEPTDTHSGRIWVNNGLSIELSCDGVTAKFAPTTAPGHFRGIQRSTRGEEDVELILLSDDARLLTSPVNLIWLAFAAGSFLPENYNVGGQRRVYPARPKGAAKFMVGRTESGAQIHAEGLKGGQNWSARIVRWDREAGGEVLLAFESIEASTIVFRTIEEQCCYRSEQYLLYPTNRAGRLVEMLSGPQSEL